MSAFTSATQLFLPLPEALLTLEQPEVVIEGEHVYACVSIVTPKIECPIKFSFELRFSTEDDVACKLQ